MSALNRIRAVTAHPLTILGSMALGVALGVWFPAIAGELAHLSDLYLALLKMIILPFMVSAIVFSVHQLSLQGGSRALAARMSTGAVLTMALCTVVTLACAIAIAPGAHLPDETLVKLGGIVGASTGGALYEEMSLLGSGDDPPVARPSALATLGAHLMPENVFATLAGGDTLKVLLFAILFGLALTRVSPENAAVVSRAMEASFRACQTLTTWFNLALPVALTALIASQIARTGLEPVQAMLGFLASQLLSTTLIAIASLWVIVRYSGKPWRQVIDANRDSIMMAIATRNAHSCMPAMIQCLVERLGFSAPRVDLLVPLGVSLLRTGQATFFVLTTVFVANLYGRALGIQELLLIGVSAVLVSMASTGMSGMLVVGLAGLICAMLALPFDAALALFMVVDAVSEPMRTLTTVLTNNAWTAAVCGSPVKVGGTAREPHGADA